MELGRFRTRLWKTFQTPALHAARAGQAPLTAPPFTLSLPPHDTMLAQSIRASRQTLARVARQQPAMLSRRTFIVPTAVRQGDSSPIAHVSRRLTNWTVAADLVQDMYLRELKAYKAPQVQASDAEGHVQKFSIPQAPKSPEESDIASELKAYETQQVELEGSSSEGSAAPVEEDWFEEEPEDEAPAAH
ncbi:ATP synthase complex subunit H-domain-containing protein [Clohesyomyces aquaticus]|uniref:ATP synthase complex subunit H-domain-containing protein n=1 Tax=Clohesyomyces aquaticus TaxID=1231657 RepID=A0A1Y1ZJG9_9PLEO|nr:ATP synthase complex subunit H-domain-containing protein [Clohesyomyces aquaticus]